jgi:hypothetical protein
MEIIDVANTVYIPITIGLVALAKLLFPSIKKFAPGIALLIGIFLSLLKGISVDAFIQGIVIGLSASGLYSGGKHTLTLGK